MKNFYSSEVDFEIKDSNGNLITDLSDNPKEIKIKNKPKRMSENIINSLLSFAIGDALGVPLEFKTKRECANIIKDNTMLGYLSHHVEAGTWSDDTSMIIATIDSLIENDEINYNDIANKYCEWINTAKYTATDVVFDVGNTTYQALFNYMNTRGDATKCGICDINSCGNGSLMRILPIAHYLNYLKYDDEEYQQVIENYSNITHANEICSMGCYIYSKLVYFLSNGYNIDTAFKFILDIDYGKYYSQDTINNYKRLLSLDFKNLEENEINSTGYIVDTLEAVVWILLNNYNYEYSLMNAIELGDDTDTIAALVGGLAGIVYSSSDIPDHWITTLKKKEELYNQFSDFANSIKNKVNNNIKIKQG